MTARLSTVAQDLVELIERASDDKRRRAAILAADFAVARSSLQDPRTDEALQAVRAGRVGATPERSAVEALAAALDDRQFDLQERVGSGQATAEEYLEAFGRARAASAVLHSGEANARIAALEALYEASAVVDDVNELRAAVVPALS